jgi:hypothetical protein
VRGEVAEQLLEDRAEQVLLGREVPEHRADGDAGRGRDLLGGRGGPTRGEDLLGRGEDPRAVATGVRPQRLT